MFSSFLTLCGQYTYYKKYYDELPNFTFVINDINGKQARIESQIYALNTNFVIMPSGSIMFNSNHMLSHSYVTYFDPYSLYWLIKYKKWIKNNIDINKLESYDLFKHDLFKHNIY
jgi:hypothetical protein